MKAVENNKCCKCGNTEYKMGKPFCTDDFCNKKISDESNEITSQTVVDKLFDLIESMPSGRCSVSRFKEFLLSKKSLYKELEKQQTEQLLASLAKSREQTKEVSMHIGFASGFKSGLRCYVDYYLELEETDLDEDEFTRNYIVDEFELTYGGDK